MKIGNERSALLFVAALVSSSAFGQAPASSASYLDQARGTGIDQLVDQAFRQNSDLLATRQRLTEAQGLLRQSAFKPNPAIDVSYGDGAPVGSGANLREVSLGYSHIFELGGKRQRRVEVSEWGVKLAELEIADRERQIRADVKSKYGDALAAIRNLQFTEELLGLNSETLQVTQARVRQGEAPAVDQGLLQVDVGRLQSDRALVENQVLRNVLAIKPLVGISLDQSLQLRGDLVSWQTGITLADALAKASQARPDLAATRIEQSLRDSEVRAFKAEAVPNLVGSVRFTRTNDLFDQFGTNRAGAVVPIRDLDKMLTAGVSIILPFRNRNQGNIQAAEARTTSAKLRSQYLEQVVAQEVTSAYRRFEAAKQARSIFEGTVLNQSQDNVRIIRAAYTAGELRLFDVLNEQRRLVDTQRAYTDVLREYYLSVVELERAIGVELP
ncbi:MAG: TolC family protein [Bryobacterales bacterium]|nr:TolC family protein [Bryobacterales bacterium]